MVRDCKTGIARQVASLDTVIREGSPEERTVKRRLGQAGEERPGLLGKICGGIKHTGDRGGWREGAWCSSGATSGVSVGSVSGHEVGQVVGDQITQDLVACGLNSLCEWKLLGSSQQGNGRDDLSFSQFRGCWVKNGT